MVFKAHRSRYQSGINAGPESVSAAQREPDDDDPALAGEVIRWALKNVQTNPVEQTSAFKEKVWMMSLLTAIREAAVS